LPACGAVGPDCALPLFCCGFRGKSPGSGRRCTGLLELQRYLYTMFSSFSPRAKRSRLAATALQRRSAVASVLLELCGVISTFGNSRNGRRDGRRSGSAGVGYCHHTSSAAPPRWPSFQRGIERILVILTMRRSLPHTRSRSRWPISPARSADAQPWTPVSLLYQKGRGLPHLSGARPRDRRFHVERKTKGTAVLTNSDLSVIIAITSL